MGVGQEAFGFGVLSSFKMPRFSFLFFLPGSSKESTALLAGLLGRLWENKMVQGCSSAVAKI